MCARTVGAWERSLFSPEQYYKSVRTVIRKLGLAPNDRALYPPLALAAQAEHFGKQKQDTLGRWISVLSPFIAFDFAASQILPESLSRAPPAPEAVPYQRVPLDTGVVKVRLPPDYAFI